jgi:hypothetical protein
MRLYKTVPGGEPKNRLSQPMDILVIEVAHADGTLRTDPNGAAATAVYGATGTDINAENSSASGSAWVQFSIIPLRKLTPIPGCISILSGNPGLILRTHDVEITMTAEEIHRLFDHSLREDEYFALRDHYGIFYEIHDDFYDLETGTALQPVTGNPLQ